MALWHMPLIHIPIILTEKREAKPDQEAHITCSNEKAKKSWM